MFPSTSCVEAEANSLPRRGGECGAGQAGRRERCNVEVEALKMRDLYLLHVSPSTSPSTSDAVDRYDESEL